MPGTPAYHSAPHKPGAQMGSEIIQNARTQAAGSLRRIPAGRI